MSKVFVAWSGNIELARKLRVYVDKVPGFSAIIGGNDAYNLDSIYVGDTIIRQIQECDQAILLIQKKKLTGQVSPNLMFEWGYVLASLNINKIHTYFIDIDSRDKDLPSDVHGIWAHSISTTDKTDDQTAKDIADIFFASQNNSLNQNKMAAVIDRAQTRDNILRHKRNPIYSNYEMAQFILCYIYSANIYRDTRDEALSDVSSLLDYFKTNENTRQSNELIAASRCAIISIEFFKEIKFVHDEQYIDPEDFDRFIDKYYSLLNSAEKLQENEVKHLIIAYVYNFMSYLNLLMINNDKVDAEDKIDNCRQIFISCKEAISKCEIIENLSKENNLQLCELMRAYMYRNIYCAYRLLDKIFSKEIESEFGTRECIISKIKQYLQLSLDERERLYNEYCVDNVNANFFANIEMEYFLSLAENGIYEDNSTKKAMYKEKLKRYVRNMDRTIAQSQIFTEKIRGYINEM